MLEYSREFIELAMRLNYTTAAEQLHLSTSALSRHIADLESELGFALLNRTPLSLTPAGQYYLESISSLIGELDNIVVRGREISRQASRPFNIYMLPSRAPFANIVYAVTAALRREHEGLATNICVDDRFLTTEEALLQGAADVGIVFAGSLTDHDDIASEVFATAPLCVYVHAESPLAEKPSVTFRDLAEFAHPKTTNRQSLTATDSIERLFHDLGLPLRLRLRNFPDRSGFFLTLREDEFLIEFDGDDEALRVNPDLVKIPFAEEVRRPILVAYRRDTDDPMVAEFVTRLKRLAKEEGIAPEPANLPEA